MRAVVVCLCASLALGFGSQARQPLTSAEAQAAIADGLSSKKVQAYRIGIFGRAYTPYLRVALAARAARDTYKPFALSDVRADMTEPTIDVHVPALDTSMLALQIVPNRSLDRFADVETVLIMPKGGTDPATAIRPISIKPVDVTMQNIFGAEFVASGVLATFSLNNVGPNFEFVAVYARPLPSVGSGPAKRELRGQIREKNWK